MVRKLENNVFTKKKLIKLFQNSPLGENYKISHYLQKPQFHLTTTGTVQAEREITENRNFAQTKGIIHTV